MSLSPRERDTLGALAGAMIPADTALGMPGADDPAILDDIVQTIARAIGHERDAARTALAEIDKRGIPGEAAINDWYAGSVAAKTLGRLILGAYYRDDRVLQALGHEARAPFPKGHQVEQGDWSLLEPVKRRAAFWRDDRGGR